MLRANLLFALLAGLVLTTACSSVSETENYREGDRERGKASWYGADFDGRPTADGETYHMHQLTAAHRHLPFGTIVLVTNRLNGRSVKVRINDRGPYKSGRIIDVSSAAADILHMKRDGIVPVEIEVLRLP